MVAAFGIFLTEVTKHVFRDHPIQTAIYGAILSSILLTFATISIIFVASLSGFMAYQGEALGWAVVILISLFLHLLPATFVSSLISIPCSHAPILTRTEQGGAGQPVKRSELVDIRDQNP